MAFRIHESVSAARLNRTKGSVHGKIWLESRTEPLTLELKGNPRPDLAGCLLTFSNPGARLAHPQLESLGPLQRGPVGDMTASRKARVFDVSFDDAYRMLKQKQKPPEHLANTLYLE